VLDNVDFVGVGVASGQSVSSLSSVSPFLASVACLSVSSSSASVRQEKSAREVSACIGAGVERGSLSSVAPSVSFLTVSSSLNVSLTQEKSARVEMSEKQTPNLTNIIPRERNCVPGGERGECERKNRSATIKSAKHAPQSKQQKRLPPSSRRSQV